MLFGNIFNLGVLNEKRCKKNKIKDISNPRISRTQNRMLKYTN